MPKTSVLIPFDPTALRELLKNRGEDVPDLELALGVSREALDEWLGKAKIPPRKLYTIADRYKWSREELATVLGKKTRS